MLPFLANQILPLTALLGAVTLGVGLAACPMQSLALQHAFVGLSAATVAGLVASIAWSSMRRAPFERRIRYKYLVIPLGLFWILLLLTFWAGSTIREFSGRDQQGSNAKQIGRGAHGIAERNNPLPSDILGPDGTLLLSWRLQICPFIEQQQLLDRFDLTKPWHSPANAGLIEEIPFVYRSVLFEEKRGETPWQGFVGPGTAFEPGKSLRLASDFPDGASYTIMFVEARQQVPWSKPADIPYGPDIPLPPLGQPYTHAGDWPFCCRVIGRPQFMVCMADATVRMFPADIPEHQMRRLIVRNDGELVDLPD